MMALMHFGIVETMIEQGCLPKVICGKLHRNGEELLYEYVWGEGH